MTFAITKYIFPLENSCFLSESLSYVIDNPRTEKEIEIVKNFISESLVESQENNYMASILTRLGFSLSDLRKGLEQKDSAGYALQYYTANMEKPLADVLAETWVILRFPDEEEFTKIANNREELFRTRIANENSGYANRFNELANYCHVLSILIQNEDDSYYHGESFLLSDNAYEVFYKSKNSKIRASLENFIHFNFSFKDLKRHEEWKYWPDAKSWLFEDAKRLESLIVQDKIIEEGKKVRLSQKQTPKQKIFHVGGLQKTAYEHLKDPELMLLLLVSIIEYLVTRNPDNNKFNVEDSISKQFKLKCAVLIHNQDIDYDLVKLSEDLNSLYSQRSDIAHGNYKEDFNIDKIVEAVRLLNKFIEHILNEYIEDRNLLEYLKDN